MRGDDYEEEYDEEVYTKKPEEEYDEEDNLEEGFMQGYEKESNTERCANCKSLVDEEEGIEEEIAGFTYRFCSEECLKEFERKQK